VIDRFVAGRAVSAPHDRVGRVVPEGDRGHGFVPAEVGRHRFADHHREREVPSSRLVLQLAVGVFRKPQVGGHVLGHRGMTVSSYR